MVRKRARAGQPSGTARATETERRAHFVRSLPAAPFYQKRCLLHCRQEFDACSRAKAGLGTDLDIDTPEAVVAPHWQVSGNKGAPLRDSLRGRDGKPRNPATERPVRASGERRRHRPIPPRNAGTGGHTAGSYQPSAVKMNRRGDATTSSSCLLWSLQESCCKMSPRSSCVSGPVPPRPSCISKRCSL